jgi:hypothetical protein
MGHATGACIVFVGLARLPQPLISPSPSVVVELEVELATRRIVTASSNLGLPGLERLLADVLVGQSIDGCAGGALLELEVRYSAPFASALRAAVQNALGRVEEGTEAKRGAVPIVEEPDAGRSGGYKGAPGATNGHGRARSIVAASSSSSASS